MISVSYHITNLTLGTPTDIEITQVATKQFRPIRVIINCPCAGFGIIDKLRLGNGFPIGHGVYSSDVCPFGPEDMFTYNPGAQGVTLDLPKLEKDDPITIKGMYTGVIPQGFTKSNKYPLILTLYSVE